MVVGEVAAQQGEAAVLGDRFAFGEADLRELQAGIWRAVMAQARKLRAPCFWVMVAVACQVSISAWVR